MTTSATTSTLPWIPSLTDAGIRSDVTTLTASGTFGYSAALTLLDDVASRGTVTAAEFSDLQTIAANLNVGIATPDYVASIFTQLVDGSPANATWTGGGTASTALGNLQVGTTATQMSELIGKWFLGSDLPDATATGSPPLSTIIPTYTAYNLPLLGSSGGPVVSDISQGDVGDCELCSGMIEVAINDPAAIQSMFVNDGNGVYGVRFYVNGKEAWVTVNDQLPTYQGSPLYNEGPALWGSLIEKAYAQLSATGDIGFPAVNSYSNITADSPFYVLTSLVNASDIQYFFSSQSNWTSFKNLFIEAIAAKDDLILESYGDTTDGSGNSMLISDHAFAVVGYDSATGDFIVRNPWGSVGANQGYDTQFEVSMADITSVNGDIVMDNVSNTQAVVGSLGQLTSIAQNTTLLQLSANAQLVMAGKAVPVTSLFWTTDMAGAAISQYMFQVAGAGSIQLNGATNLATAAQQALGEVVVSAADLAKVSLAAGSATGSTDLLVSVNDGSGWITPTDIPLTITASPLLVTPALNVIVAPAATVSIASLFSMSGTLGSSVTYEVISAGNLGTINLNGAQNLLTHASAGEVEVSAAGLASLTYAAPTTSGSAVLEVYVNNGSTVSDMGQVPIMVGTSVAAAVHSFNAGTMANQIAVADTAANVFANLDALQTMMPPWDLLGIAVTDTTAHETVTATQFANDAGALSIISGNYSLTVTGASVAQGESLLNNGQSHVSAVQIADSTANVLSNLGNLQTLAAAGHLSSITLTDGGTPTLTVTAAQAAQDAAALHTLTGSYTLAVTGTTATLGSFLAKEDVTGRGLNGIAADYAGTAPAGGNAVGGFQNAAFTGGYDAVVLDGPRSNYAIQVAANGATTIKDIGAGDASYGQTITVSGESYLVFNSGASTTVSGLPVYGSIYFVDSPANAQLAQFYAAATQFKSSIALSGLEYWQNQLAAGMSLTAIAQSFLNTSYFQTTYGDPGTTHASHLAFVETLYKNILGMTLDASNAGVQYWTGDMDNGMSGAVALISFTNATANTSVLNAVSGTTAGSGSGWLIDPAATGGYADPGLQMAAQTVLSQGAAANFYNLSLVDPTTVGSAGVSAGAVTLTPGTITLGASAPGSTVYLSASFTHLVANNGGDSIHDGPGADSITVSGTGNVLTLGNATSDSLNLANSTGDYVFGFTPGKASLAVSGIANPTAATLLTPTAPVQGTNLNFGGSSPIFIAIGGVGGNTAAQVAAAANTVYVAADSAAEHVVFLGTDSGGNAQIWSFHPTAGATDHQVDANELTLVATLVGVPATSLTAAMLS